MSEHLRWGNAGRWPLDNLHSALRPHTHLPLSLVMAAEWRDQPVPPVLSPGKEHVREWAATNQSFTSIFCLSALWAGLPVRSHVPQTYRMWPHSCTLNFSLSSWASYIITSFHYVELKSQSANVFFFFLTQLSTLIFGYRLCQLHHPTITLLLYFVYLAVCLLFCFFHSHVSLPYFTLEPSP